MFVYACVDFYVFACTSCTYLRVSTEERDHVNMLLNNAQENNESENLLVFIYKVRGQPYDLQIVKRPNKVAKK